MIPGRPAVESQVIGAGHALVAHKPISILAHGADRVVGGARQTVFSSTWYTLASS